MSMSDNLIIYDGDCIFCQNYVRLVRLREAIGPVDLVDARSDDPRVTPYRELGYDLNEGMLFVWRGSVHHGSDAIHLLARLSTASGWFNSINGFLFSSSLVARLLYPFLKIGRRVTLFVRGKTPLRWPPNP
jgi:predicted DCC family thiol-disulfide oxidoreductase YuxK